MNFLFANKSTFFSQLNQIIFRIFFAVFMILFIIEYIEPGFVTNWFNPIWLLIITIISAIIVTVNN